LTAKILVVDDESSIVAIAEMILKDAGYDVLTAKNGVEAVQIFRRENPDLIFLDLLMPEMDGIDTCRRLKALKIVNGASCHATVVMFTVSDDEADREKAEKAGCDGYMLKPFTPEELLREAEAHLSKVSVTFHA